MAKVGRPTEYSPEILAKTKKYLATTKDKYKKGKLIKVNLPSIAGLAVHLKVSRDTIYEWKSKLTEDGKGLLYPEFSDILAQILAEQERRLMEMGLIGEYNPTIAKLALGKHGYHDKVDTDVTTKGEKVKGFELIPPNAGPGKAHS
jgi:hypothetical protein